MTEEQGRAILQDACQKRWHLLEHDPSADARTAALALKATAELVLSEMSTYFAAHVEGDH